MLNRYEIYLIVRILIFLSVLWLWLTHRELLTRFMTEPIWHVFTPLHVLWFYFMGIMILHIFPNNRLTMALRKSRQETYQPREPYDELELLRFVQDQNRKAWRVLLIWLCMNAVWGLLYLFQVIGDAELLMLSVFYFLCDYICILFFCPFQTFVMGNKCCVNCRIFDWGHFMMFTPMLFIRNFFSWSLFFTSVVVLIHWELLYAAHPERFWFGSNETIRCENCRDKTCQWKEKLAHLATK